MRCERKLSKCNPFCLTFFAHRIKGRGAYGWRFSRAEMLAAVWFCLAAAVACCAGNGLERTATNQVAVSATVTNVAATNPLRLWLDVPTNASRSNVSARADGASTNLWQPPGLYDLAASLSTWRTTATLETGFFHARDNGDFPGCGHRSVDGWYQEVGVGMERDIVPGDSSIFVGFGVDVGRATIHGP